MVSPDVLSEELHLAIHSKDTIHGQVLVVGRDRRLKPQKINSVKIDSALS